MQFKFSGFIVRKKKTTSEFNLYFLPKEYLDIFSGDLGIVELNVLWISVKQRSIICQK